MSGDFLPPVKGFVRNTLVDWEGEIACVLFLPGCNFRCAYCHARVLVRDADRLPTTEIQEVLEYLRRNRGWIDGVVVSGGEPTIHPNLDKLIALLRSEHVKVKLDTNGSRPEVLERLIGLGLLDYVAMDVKAPLDERYGQVAGLDVDLCAVRKSVALLIRGIVDYEFRTTVCPETLKARDVVDLARDIAGARRLVLQPFRPVDCLDAALEAVRPYPRDELRKMADAARGFVLDCGVRGDFGGERSALLREA